MAMENLGPHLDLHGGGTDLIFPHHECEIAQSESVSGEPFCGHWMHSAMVSYEGEKMSKSLGNLVFVSDLLKTADPRAIRLALMRHHYRAGFEWYDTDLEEGTALLHRLSAAASASSGPDPAPFAARVRATRSTTTSTRRRRSRRSTTSRARFSRAATTPPRRRPVRPRRAPRRRPESPGLVERFAVPRPTSRGRSVSRHLRAGGRWYRRSPILSGALGFSAPPSGGPLVPSLAHGRRDLGDVARRLGTGVPRRDHAGRRRDVDRQAARQRTPSRRRSTATGGT